MSLLLRKGILIDGAGRDGRRGDVRVIGAGIAEVGVFRPPEDVQVLDCTGLVVSPGFADVHSRSDLQMLEDRHEKVRQGVTSEVVGNCGFSPYPAVGDPRPPCAFANGIFCGDESWGWPSARAYLEAVARSPIVDRGNHEESKRQNHTVAERLRALAALEGKVRRRIPRAALPGSGYIARPKVAGAAPSE